MALFLMNAVGAGATSLQQHRRSGSGGGGGDTADDDRLVAQSQRQRDFHCTRVNVARLLACCEQHLAAAAAATSGDPLVHDDSVMRRHAMISKFLIKAKDQASQLEAYHSEFPDAAASRELLAIARRIAAIGDALKARGGGGIGIGAGGPSADVVRADLAARRRHDAASVAATASLARGDANSQSKGNASAEAAVLLALQLQSRAESRHRAETLGLQGARLEYSSLGGSPAAARSQSRSAHNARRLPGAGSLSAGAAAVLHMLDGDGGDGGDGGDEDYSGNAAAVRGVPDASATASAASAAAMSGAHASRSHAAAARTASNSAAALPFSDSATVPRSVRATPSGGSGRAAASGLTAVASSGSGSSSGDDIGAKKEAIKASMARLARELKENTQRIAAALAADRSTLDETEAAAAGNVSTLRADNAKLRAQSESGCGTTWLAVGALAFAALVFVLMYVFMKIFPKPRVAVGAS